MCPKVTSQHKQEVRGRIIQSAIECFSKNGFDRTRMDEISLLADLSKGTLYNYFDNKEDLFNAICEDSLDLLKIQLNQIFTKSKDDLIFNAELFYENFQKIQKEGSAKVFFEALSESTRNPKLKIICSNIESKSISLLKTICRSKVIRGLLKVI